MSNHLTEFPDRRGWNLSGYAVEWIQISYQGRQSTAINTGAENGVPFASNVFV